MEALLSRLETATGADDPALVADLFNALGDQAIDRGKLGWAWRPDGVGIWRNMPDLLNSLDAAVALALRCGWRLRGLDASIPERPSAMLQSCEQRRFDDEDERRSGWCHDYSGAAAKTMPTAIVAALLKALQAQPNREEEGERS